MKAPFSPSNRDCSACNRLHISVFVFVFLSVCLLRAAEEPLKVIVKETPVRAITPPVAQTMPFYIFNNAIVPPVRNFAASGYMGDIPDIKVVGGYKNLHQENCPTIKITYLASGPMGWSGVYWQNPPNNWGALDGGYNLSNAKKLSFWARGDKGGEVVEFRIGGTLNNFPDTANLSTGDLRLTNAWTQYVIDLTGADLRYVSAGFGFIMKQETNPQMFTFYLDDIKYE